MNKTTNLQKLRENRGLGHEELSSATGVPAATIASAEAGEGALTAEELYDLAVFFETGTSDLLERDELAVTTHLDYPENEDYDGFWGHVGILLHGQQHTKWYPITTTASDAIAEDLQNLEKGFIAIRTLNNRVLFVNPLRVKKIMLNDDDAGAPPDFEDVARYMSPASYEAIREWYWEKAGAGEVSYSPKVRKLVEALLKEENLDEKRIEEVLLKTFIYYRDGSSESYHADSAHLGNIWALGRNLNIPIISIPERNDLFDCWYSAQAIALIDTPYLELAGNDEEEKPLHRKGVLAATASGDEGKKEGKASKGAKGSEKKKGKKNGSG
ncbi:helix-turn-helix transcriptional regulator [Geomonas sp. RF6]|uniref:helix-turn-helix domain-containing protein n=1 Tax=Geomonas sp. RF6 TaxID=2897342 RepID=UPI001E6261DB|nr:helix-turn-helix transcriptional regulator [Geomonas sp. RF6]UFS68924.1 helix-turn-helix transcriptional regulator [Geomonas sp. RF6]